MPNSKKLKFKDNLNSQLSELAPYSFHDGSIIAINHDHQIVQFAMESAEIGSIDINNSKATTIKGILTLSELKMIEVDRKAFNNLLTMRADSATILEFDWDESKVHFFVEWINYPENDIDERYTDIVIHADVIRWDTKPDMFDPYRLAIIEERFVIPLIILAVPSMKDKLTDPFCTAFHALVELSDHVIENYKSGKLVELPRIFNLIERLFKEGEASVQEAAAIGFLEGIQNRCSHADTGISADYFVPYLGQESKREWDALNDFWNGK